MTTQTFTVADILRTSDYAPDIFDQSEIDALDIFEKNGRAYLLDFTNSGKERTFFFHKSRSPERMFLPGYLSGAPGLVELRSILRVSSRPV